MNHRIRTVCWLLILVLTVSALSCRRREQKTDAPAPAAAIEATPASTGTHTPETPQPVVFAAPEEGCAIAFPNRPLYHYDMDLTLNEADHTVSGHVVFDFYNDSKDPWDKLCMRDYPSLFTDPESVGYDSSMEIHGAVTEIGDVTDGRDGSRLACERDDDVSVIWLGLQKPLAPNEWMTLEYDFQTTVPTVADRFGYEAGVFNVTNFYPILAEYADGDWSHAAYYDMGECFFSETADYDVTLTVPLGFTAATTGAETGKTETDDAVTYTFHAPCVRDFVFSASGTFVWENAAFDGVRVNVLYNSESKPTSDMTAPVEAAFRAAEDSLAAFGEAFGKYPYEELDIILAPIYAGGMEYPNLVIIADMLCDPDYSGETDDRRYDPLKDCIAHEIAHQWFMGIVGNDSGMQPWQDESF
ncbi:MAG: M1 family metallopeptidase, partial [Clostridia bacterium]|nr:M1 family metallopeptidase [Clostridia bacterium]